MSKRFLKYISCLAIVCVLLTTIAVPAYAYVKCGYKLKGSWYDDHYYISDTSVTYNNTTVNYGSISDDAVSAWNDAVDSSSGHSLDIDLSETTNGSASTTRVVVSPTDRGATGWRGFTYYYDYNVLTDEWSTVNYGGYPNQNYQSGSAVINLYYVHTNSAWRIQNTIMHEMGHIFGLKHSTTTGALMVSNSASYTELTLPQSDDISGVRAIYE